MANNIDGFQTQSDIALNISKIDLKNNFKEKYFACLKKRVEFGRPNGDKKKLYECINGEIGWNYFQKIKETMEISAEDELEIKLAEKLMRLANINDDFAKEFEIITGDNTKEKKQLLIKFKNTGNRFIDRYDED